MIASKVDVKIKIIDVNIIIDVSFQPVLHYFKMKE